ncbi:hypothetical protein M5D96_006007 [Drosophila gunungcola]|uniref:Uncharacterized protein n=1 Tax=Drosophila gunungcola TaxID=103775 RepID=A0A9P9YS24_9MUSC|nr:hypothetical protein M5D96_006007 [Drosophila gunungcola]
MGTGARIRMRMDSYEWPGYGWKLCKAQRQVTKVPSSGAVATALTIFTFSPFVFARRRLIKIYGN